jgi:hypothetical protein
MSQLFGENLKYPFGKASLFRGGNIGRDGLYVNGKLAAKSNDQGKPDILKKMGGTLRKGGTLFNK